MIGPVLDQQRIGELLDQLGARLNGEWLLVGGALVSIWVEPRRVTEDIDIVSLDGSQDARLSLMDAAFALGLPIEAVNSAADFFVHRIPGWQGEIEPLRNYPDCVFYRPTPTLFVLLKMGRLSEQDLSDCIAVLAKARLEQLPIAKQRLADALSELGETNDLALKQRRVELARALAR